MLPRKLTRFIAAGAAAIAIGGGAYGIVSATASSGSGTASTTTTGKVIPFHRGQPSRSKLDVHKDTISAGDLAARPAGPRGGADRPR
jgi:hypothetical protein